MLTAGRTIQLTLEAFAEHGYTVTKDQITFFAPLRMVSVVHIDIAVLSPGAAASLLGRLKPEDRVGAHFVVCHGPLVPGQWFGYRRERRSGDRTDDAPLRLLARETLADLEVWLDAQETIATEPEISAIVRYSQRLVAEERALRVQLGEPPWTWPRCAGSFDATGNPVPLGNLGDRHLRRVREAAMALLAAAPPSEVVR